MAEPDGASLFDLEEMRLAGIEAYRPVHAAVTDNAARERYLEDAAEGDRSAARSLVSGLPPPVESLPLWVVASLAAHATWGALEIFYTMAPDGSAATSAREAASAPLRAWLDQHLKELEHLVLLPTGHEDMVWQGWLPAQPGEAKVEMARLTHRAKVVADHFPVAWEPAMAFVLVRDHYLDLGPLLRALGLEVNALVLEARRRLDELTAAATGESVQEVQQKAAPGPTLKPPAAQAAAGFEGLAEQAVVRYTELLGGSLPELRPDSPWALLLAFGDPFLDGPLSLAEALADEERVVEALRSASGASAASSQGPGYRPSATISTDYWTVEDRLGSALYADAITEFICHPDTRPPLTIGIKAPWGAGKTSLMRMVRERLDPGANDGRRQLVKAADGDVKVTNREALSRAPEDGGEEPGIPHLERDLADRRRGTVWFNPWVYQSGEHLWAGLAQAIIDGVTEHMDPRERERFWFELNIRRIDPSRVRHQLYRLLVERVLWVALPGAVLLVAGLAVLAAFPGLLTLAGGLSLAGLLWAGAGAAWRAGRFLEANVNVSFDELVRQPDYEGRAGFLYLVHEDMRRVLDLVATPERPLVVFVDDLDRCNADVVAQVIEALNLFLAGQYPNCVFVLAVEPDVVAAHLEVSRGDLLKVLAEHLPATSHFGMGWRFLDKMVQLPLRLPAPEKEHIDTYIDGVLGSSADRRAVNETEVRRRADRLKGKMASVEDLRVAAAEVQTDEHRQQHPGTTGTRSDWEGPLDPETIRAAELAFAERLRDDAPEVREAIRGYAPYLARNPREVKRFVNLFRFYAFVQVRRELRDLPAPTLAQVGKMAIIAIRWPYLLSVLGLAVPADRASSVLAALEQAAGDAGTWTKATQEAGLREKMQALITADEDLRRVLATGPPLADVIGFL